jgi:hypothetical protein
VSADAPTLRDVPPVQRRRKLRDLERAVWLRPRDIEEIYGLSASTLHELATHTDPARRLPSSFVKARGGKRGLRLVKRADLDAYLAQRMDVAA